MTSIDLFLAILVVIALVAVLIRVGRLILRGAGQTQQGFVRQLCDALYPDFTWPHTGRDTTQTFHLLVSVMAVFALSLTIWSVGAGLMHAAYVLTLKDTAPNGFVGLTPEPGRSSWQLWLFTLIQVLRAVGGVWLLALAGGAAGGFLGFLFGIPRRISADGTSADGKSATNAGNGSDYALSTNLTQISDWLTKVIVGVSLVEAKSAYDGFTGISTSAAVWLFQSRHGSPAVIGAAIGGAAILGFLFFYLYTQLIVSRLIAAAERALGVAAGATAVLRGVLATAPRLVPPIRRTANPIEPHEQSPTQEEYDAALAYYAIPFSEIANNPAISDEEILSWARARALLDDYKGAVQGYILLIARRRL